MSEKLRVAVYCRFAVAGEDEATYREQLKIYYDELMNSHDDWEYIGIYIDHGAGTRNNQRPELKRLLRHCKAGKIDLIVTRNASRLYRNAIDVIDLMRRLRMLERPVGVYIEDTKLKTLVADGLPLSLLLPRR